MKTPRILAIAAVLLLPAFARGWSAKMHVYAANEVLRDVLADGAVDLGEYGIRDVDPVVVGALHDYSEYFRAGAIGPDCYPDIFVGQAFTHPDNSHGLLEDMLRAGSTDCESAVLHGWCSSCAAPSTAGGEWCHDPADAAVPERWRFNGMEFSRPRKYWRAIDWAEHLYDAAQHEYWCMEHWDANGVPVACRPGVRIPASLAYELSQAGAPKNMEEVRKALAFAFGYLLHYPADAFGHNWVNLYAGGAWDYFDAHPEYEYRHVVVERFTAWSMLHQPHAASLPADTTVLDLEAPNWFVVRYLMGEDVADDSGAAQGTDSGAPSASHIRYLYAYKHLLLRIKQRFGIPDQLEPTGIDWIDGEAPPVFDPRNPQSYSSIWSYMVNYCFESMAFDAAQGSQQTCVQDLFRVTFAAYILNRLAAVDRALLDWSQVSTAIARQVISEDFDLAAVRALLDAYWLNDVYPLFIPAPGEDIRDFFGLSCADVGPPNFEHVCQAMTAAFRQVVDNELDEVDAAAHLRFRSYFDAYDRMLCSIDWLIARWTNPDLLMNLVYCDGSEQSCPLSTRRKHQILSDMFLDGDDPRTMLPFKNSVDLSKFVLLRQSRMAGIASAANALTIADAPLISLTDPGGFVVGEAYDKIIWESIASLDGTQPIIEESTDWANPQRVLFDQLRKPPVFALIRDPGAKARIQWRKFEINRQDPDGDQIYLALDLCPCIPQTRAENEQDRDGDGIGDACDADSLSQDAAASIQAMPDEGFGPPALGVKLSFTYRLENTVGPACERNGNAAALLLVDTMFAEVDALLSNGVMNAWTAAAVQALLQDLHNRFASNGVYCAGMPPPGEVTSCP